MAEVPVQAAASSPERLTVRRGRSATTSWEMISRAPSYGLAEICGDYNGFSERCPDPVARREFPSMDVVLVVTFGEPIAVQRFASPSPQRFTSFVAGPGDQVIRTEHAGVQDGVEIRFPPLAARQLFGVAASELAGRVVDLADLWGKAGAVLAEQLAEADSWQTRFAVVDETLFRARARSSEPDEVLVTAWRSLYARHGDIPVSELVGEAGWSSRRFAERFAAEIGLTPKAAARVLRFGRAARLLTADRRPTLAAIALTCGYYDQAHLNRDFRLLAGCTPTEYLAAHLEDLPGVGAAT